MVRAVTMTSKNPYMDGAYVCVRSFPDSHPLISDNSRPAPPRPLLRHWLCYIDDADINDDSVNNLLTISVSIADG